MANCTFCGKKLPPGTGTTLFKRTGAVQYLCSRKCERNLEMGRSPRKRKWTRSKAGK